MKSPSQLLGLSSLSSETTTPNLSPYYLILHFLFAYVILSTRALKIHLGIDNNVSPREDVSSFGEAAVKSGKITRSQLRLLKRNEAAHANAVENYALFVGAMVLGSVSGVENDVVNWVGLSYTGARVVYAVAYLGVESWGLSWVRTLAWWWGNLSCLVLLWRAGGRM